MKNAVPKISEIAEYLGVSRPTVSYVLNDRWEKRGISKATADRILKYVQETGFLPNPASLALQGRSVKDIAIIVDPNTMEHQKRAFFSLLEHLEKSGKSYMMMPFTESHLAETAQFIKMYNIPRVIAITTSSYSAFHEKWRFLFKNLTDIDYFFYDFPFDRINNPETLLFSPKSIAVGINREDARLKALKYILTKGYKNIILPERFFDDYRTKDFMNGIHLDFYKMPLENSLYKMGWEIGEQLLKLVKKSKGPSAVYINDDLISATVMRCFKEKGLSVPEDLAILSWDGLPESDYFIAPLSTCVIPHEKMIQAAMDWIEDKPFETKQIIFDIEIREGKTLPGMN